ncbi:MAG TPA: cytochrome c [Rhodocyclaceae bacterium]|nr:cytochrome c [Rhodocyclaceae bacterium]
MKPRVIGLLLAAALGIANAEDGGAVYAAHCAACHQPDGAGALGLAPPLQGTLGKRLASESGRQYVAGVVLAGLAGKIESKGVVYNGIMPSWQQLSDAELAAVVNHVLATFNAAELPAGHVAYEAETFVALRGRKPSGRELRAWRAESE